ncbi:caspase-3-like [Diadema antillarum]|uniref:caspase-3-like n=1 Tax=Diadema antillarum TaxID=105358 RepID=UPI003A88DA5A
MPKIYQLLLLAFSDILPDCDGYYNQEILPAHPTTDQLDPEEEITKELHSLKDEIKNFHTSVVVVLMSHGTDEGISGTDNEAVQMKEIKEVFSGRNCPQLNGKPKIFFIQACRGGKLTQLATDSAVEPVSQRVQMDYSPHLQADGRGYPENADMFICYATSEGYVSLRHPFNGSWFIQALCEELIVRAHKDDLYTIMTKVRS